MISTRLAAASFTLELKALLLGVGLALAGTPFASQAQSLSDLYDVARGYDASYQSARAQADSVKFRAEQALALRRPTVNFGAGVTRTVAGQPASVVNTVSVTPAPPPAAPFTSTSTTTNYDTSGQTVAQVAVTAQQTLYNPAVERTIEKANYTVEAAQAQLLAAEQDLIIRLTQGYFDVLAARDALGTVQTSKKAISEQLASAKRNFEVGTATITDTREAQARFDLAVAQELAADNDLRVKQLALDNLVGRTGVNPKPLAVPVALPAPSPAVVEEWVTQAEANSPAIRSNQLALSLARSDIAIAQAAKLPVVTLSASVARPYTRSGSRREGSTGNGAAGPTVSTSETEISGLGRSAAIGVNLTMPLYTGGSLDNRVRETLSLEEKATNDLEASRRGIAQATRAAFFGTQSGLAQVKALEAAESSSKLALEATQLGYKVGVRVNLDVLNAQTQLFTTQRDLSKARYDAVVAGLKLRQAAGTLNASDVNAVNQLLAK